MTNITFVLSIGWFIALAAAKPTTKLTWVNGIAYNLGHMESGQKEISQLFGGKPVEYCHNPTSMSSEEDFLGYVGDLTQAGTQKMGRITTEVNELVQHLKQAVVDVGERGCVLHIAHSQGALLTALAARQLTALEMNQIEVMAFGGAAALTRTQSTPWRRVVNYYAINDPLLLVVPLAAAALRSGFRRGPILNTSSSSSSISNDVISQNNHHEDEFCFLVPRDGDPIRDHNLLGPTYAMALSWEGKRFQRLYQSLGYRMGRTLLLFLYGILLRLQQWLLFVWYGWITMVESIRDAIGFAFDATKEWIEKKIITPMVALFLLLAEWIQNVYKSIRKEETYRPVEMGIDS